MSGWAPKPRPLAEGGHRSDCDRWAGGKALACVGQLVNSVLLPAHPGELEEGGFAEVVGEISSTVAKK